MTVSWRHKYSELADLAGAELAGHDRRFAVQQETAEDEVRVRAKRIRYPLGLEMSGR
jgi:hypothetical protein